MDYATLEHQRSRTARLRRKHLIERMTPMPENGATERTPRYVVEPGSIGRFRVRDTWYRGVDGIGTRDEADARVAALNAAAEAEEKKA